MEATFQLPASLLEVLRERSREEGRSLDVIAEDALWRGLSKQPDDRVVKAPKVFDDEALRSLEALWSELPESARSLSEGLEWAR